MVRKGSAESDSPTTESIAGRIALQRAAAAGELDAVRAQLESENPALRASAISALVRLGVATEVEIAARLADPSSRVRRVTLELGKRLPSVALDGCLSDSDSSVVEAACFAAGESGEARYVERLITIARDHADPLASESAIAALGALGDERAVPVLLSSLEGVPAIRRRAAVALAAFESEEITAALRARLEDRDWQVRQVAEEVLRAGGSA